MNSRRIRYFTITFQTAQEAQGWADRFNSESCWKVSCSGVMVSSLAPAGRMLYSDVSALLDVAEDNHDADIIVNCLQG